VAHLLFEISRYTFYFLTNVTPQRIKFCWEEEEPVNKLVSVLRAAKEARSSVSYTLCLPFKKERLRKNSCENPEESSTSYDIAARWKRFCDRLCASTAFPWHHVPKIAWVRSVAI